MELVGSVALITGASRGIGRAIALALSSETTGVIVNYKANDRAAHEVVVEAAKTGGRAYVCQADVSDAKQVDKLMDFAVTKFGRLDILVNNAGAFLQPSSWADFSQESWESTLDVNLKSTLLCTRAAVSHLMRTCGSIINIASTFGPYITASDAMVYGVAKAGVVAATRSLAKTLAPKVRVNCVAPGVIATDMTARSPQEFVSNHIRNTPLQRLGTPEDVAHAVAFLASSAAAFITGQVLVVDGGHSIV